LKWIDNSSHRQNYSALCFSQIPSASVANYLVVFSTSDVAFQGLTPTAQTYTSADSAGSNGEVSSYGGTWTHAYAGVPAPATTATVDLKRDDKPKAVNVRAYDQRGRIVSKYSLSEVSSRDKLLERVFADIVADSAPPAKQKPFASPLSIYYVNCDVDGRDAEIASARHIPPPEAADPPPPRPAAPPKPAPEAPPTKPVLDISSVPAGADIFVDGEFVGKTPASVEVSQGEHALTLRKRDFGSWQRTVQAATGKRKISVYLEQKMLELQ